MASKDKKSRPNPVNTSKSFVRYEPASPPTSQSPQAPPGRGPPQLASPRSPIDVKQQPSIPERTHSDIFETQDDEDDDTTAVKHGEEDVEDSFPEGFDELPIEVQSLMER